MGRANELIEGLSAAGAAPECLEWSPDLPDTLHALCRLMVCDEEADREHFPPTAAKAYTLVEQTSWPDDHFEERSGVLASLAFAAWSQFRRAGQYAQMEDFGDRCLRHVTERAILRDFLALPFEQRSAALNSLFLSDPPVLLASVLGLIRIGDTTPQIVAVEAPQLYAWVVSEQGRCTSEETAWLAASAARCASGSLRFLGQLTVAEEWLEVARSWLRDGPAREMLEGSIEYTRLSILYAAGKYQRVVEAAPKLSRHFKSRGLALNVAKVAFVEACALKALGDGSALGRFQRLADASVVQNNSTLLGLCLVNAADLTAQGGQYGSAMKLLGEARPLLEEAGIPWGIGHLESVVAEILRDQGRLPAAIAGYRAAVATYSESGLEGQAGYMRVVLAETLIAAGREAEAIVELLAALPVIERESLAREGVAASALLRASLQRCHADPQALHALREQLDRMRKGGEL